MERLDTLESAIQTAKEEIKFRTPSAPVLGLNIENQLKFAAVGVRGSSRTGPSTGYVMETDDVDNEYVEEEESEGVDAYAVLDDSTSSPSGRARV